MIIESNWARYRAARLARARRQLPRLVAQCWPDCRAIECLADIEAARRFNSRFAVMSEGLRPATVLRAIARHRAAIETGGAANG